MATVATSGVAIIGAGELGRHLAHFLKCPVTFFDDNSQLAEFPFDAFREKRFSDFDFYVGLGYRHLEKRASILGELETLGRKIPALVHPSSYLGDAKIGAGAFVFPMCNLGQSVSLGKGVILHGSVTLSHDSSVGECSYLAPAVITSGHVQIGKFCFLGTGALVSDGVTIGDRVRIGIGTVVTHDLAPRSSHIGNPSRQLEQSLEI